VSESNNNPPGQQKSSSTGRSFLRGFMRVILVLLVGALLGLAVYLLFFFLFPQIIAQPLDQLGSEINIEETRQAQFQSVSSTRVYQLGERVSQVENNQTTHEEDISSLQGQQSILQTALPDQALTQQAGLEQALTQVAQQANTQQSLLQNMQGLSTSQAQRYLQIEGTLTALQATFQVQNELNLVTIQQDVRLLRALDLLEQAQAQLIQHNLGLATQSVSEAQQIMTRLIGMVSPEEQVTLSNWIQGLQTAIDDLPQYPQRAETDLNIVISMMTAGLYPGSFTPTPTPTYTPNILPYPEYTGTLPPTPTPYQPPVIYTPTPVTIPTATPTPI
jgi:hypothetical protein